MHCLYSQITTYNVGGITEDLRRVYYIEISYGTKKKCSVSREIYPEVCRENQACLSSVNGFVCARLATGALRPHPAIRADAQCLPSNFARDG